MTLWKLAETDDEALPLTVDDFPQKPRGKESSNRLILRHKVCYGLGSMPYQLTNTVVGFYISVFLLDTAQITPASASAVIFAGRIWDAITDPFVGYVVMKSDTRFGKLKPWMVFGSLFASVTYFFLWYVPDFTENGYLLAWYLLFYCAFQTALSFYHMPYTTLTMYLSEDQLERDSATFFRMTCEVMANVIGNLVMGQSVAGFTRGYDGPNCENGSLNATSDPDYLEREKLGYSVGALTISVIILLSASSALFGTKEKKIKKKDREDEMDFGAGVRKVLTFKPYVMLMLAFVFLMLAGMTAQGSFALFYKYVMHIDDYQTFILLIMVFGVLLIPIWNQIMLRFGKKPAFLIGGFLFLPLFIVHGVLPEGYDWVLYLTCILAGNMLAVIMLLPWSMVPDVIDDFLLKTDNTYEAVFYAFFVMFMKFGTGFALAISNLALGAAGYVAAACEQPSSVTFTLRLLVSAVPLGISLIGLVFVFFYPITEEIRKRNKTILEIWRNDKDVRRRTTVLKSKEQRSRTRSYRTPSTTVM
ncbi:sodium-dependent lysophosphatidylcholine symporter 1-like [Diadema antillarum]|uniref:sodium-dependent lysophosphatidylcholine symporter 1-like n=1 Tax=Diadema antillarum TaxID=105358 RepID=UPI003A886B3F